MNDRFLSEHNHSARALYSLVYLFAVLCKQQRQMTILNPILTGKREFMTSNDAVITSSLPNDGQLGSANLDFWILSKLQESADIERKVIKTNKGTLILAKTQKYCEKSVFFCLF